MAFGYSSPTGSSEVALGLDIARDFSITASRRYAKWIWLTRHDLFFFFITLITSFPFSRSQAGYRSSTAGERSGYPVSANRIGSRYNASSDVYDIRLVVASPLSIRTCSYTSPHSRRYLFSFRSDIDDTMPHSAITCHMAVSRISIPFG